MKLEDSVEIIRTMIFNACDKRLSQLGLLQNKQYEIAKVPQELQPERGRADDILNNLTDETGDSTSAREKLIDELSFTLFNRIACVKVIEAHQLIPEVFSRRESHGGRSFGHKLWLEQNPESAGLKMEGLREYIRHAFDGLSKNVQLYSADYLYDMLPNVFDLNAIIEEFNRIEEDDWKSDDVMGWMYEYYNRKKRESFKAGGEKIEYQWVPLTSQIYTPRWVVEFILNNCLGKLWMEMHPESGLKDNHDIANVPEKPEREIKPVEEIKLLDPAVGSGNFLLYAFDLLYEMYLEQGYDEKEIPSLIIENNLYGIDLDDRAVQIAQLGLYIKAIKRNKDARISRMNVVSTDFYLPEYEEIGDFFKGLQLHDDARELLKFIWDDLRMAHKFGSLIRIEERLYPVIERYKLKDQQELFGIKEEALLEQWKMTIIPKIKEAVEKYTTNGNGKSTFFQTKTLDSLTFVEILQNKFDVVVANPPYTDSANYGPELKTFINDNYKKPQAFHSNLFATFLKRNTELLSTSGKVGIIHPLTFMYIKSFEDLRKYILSNFHINLFVEYGLSDLFGAIMADPAIYILEKGDTSNQDAVFISMNQYTRTPEENFKEQYTKEALYNYINNIPDKNLYTIDQSKLKQIKSWPFIYWISDEFREKFGSESIDDQFYTVTGLMTGNNNRFLRFHWEVAESDLSKYYPNGSYSRLLAMCGICGKLTTNGKRIEEDLLQRMTSVLSHRGPDDEGVYLSSKVEVGLGHRRLSIIDLSEAGRQPMSNEDKTVWMVFNGEIYNFRSLRTELEGKGHHFSSQTDCEVVIHLYEEEGIEGVKKLDGMFAFAIWDEKSQELFLCRDRLGIKPLIYYWNGRTLVFASEIKGLLQDQDVPREIDWDALGLYVTFNSITAPYTIFKGIKKLRPGHILIFSKGEIEEKEYWNIDRDIQIKTSGEEDFTTLKNRLFKVMEDAVKIRMIADVPLGAFLSGGIDSSIIVGLMARNSSKPVKTYSIGYEICWFRS